MLSITCSMASRGSEIRQEFTLRACGVIVHGAITWWAWFAFRCCATYTDVCLVNMSRRMENIAEEIEALKSKIKLLSECATHTHVNT